jgi:REP element-mobilizing transposase RayT
VASLSDIVGAFKSLTTNAYSRGVREYGWELFHGHLWQRSFHDRIIQSHDHLQTVRAYIENNPANWLADAEHPSHHPSPPSPR